MFAKARAMSLIVVLVLSAPVLIVASLSLRGSGPATSASAAGSGPFAWTTPVEISDGPSGHHSAPRIALLRGQDPVATWTDSIRGGALSFATQSGGVWRAESAIPLYDVNGLPLTVTTSHGLAADSRGLVHEVWAYQNDQDPSCGCATTQILDSMWDGLSWSAPVGVASSPNPIRISELTTGQNGALLLAWVDSGSGLFIATWNGRWSPSENVPGIAAGGVATLDTGGVVHVAGTQPISGMLFRLIYLRRDAVGWSAPEIIADPNTASKPGAAGDIAVDGAGIVHVFWTSEDGIGTLNDSRITPSVVQTTPIAVHGLFNVTHALNMNGVLSLFYRGNSMIEYYPQDLVAHVFVQQLADSGWSPRTEIPLFTSSGTLQQSQDLHVAFDVNGQAHIVWNAQVPSQLFFRVFYSEGVPLVTPPTVTATSTLTQTPTATATPSPASATAHVFQDSNHDGQQQPGEPNLPGWAVRLYGGGDCSGPPVSSAGTDASGDTIFDGLTPATYAVGEVVPQGWIHTSPPCQVVTISSGNSQTLNFAIARLTYVATGDSYPNGEDVAAPGVADRSRAYPALLDNALLALGNPLFLDFSCSGATTLQYMIVPQCNFLRPQLTSASTAYPDLVTITEGADDFLPALTQCVRRVEVTWMRKCVTTALSDETAWSQLSKRLDDIIGTYLARPGTLVVLANYPFPGMIDCRSPLIGIGGRISYLWCIRVNQVIIPILRDKFIGRLTTVMQSAAARSTDPSRVAFVDVSGQFVGHEYWSSQPWFATTSWQFAAPHKMSVPYGVHPNATGQSCIAKLMWEAIKGRLGSTQSPLADPCP